MNVVIHLSLKKGRGFQLSRCSSFVKKNQLFLAFNAELGWLDKISHLVAYFVNHHLAQMAYNEPMTKVHWVDVRASVRVGGATWSFLSAVGVPSEKSSS